MYTIIIPSGSMQNLAACRARLQERRIVIINETPFCFARAINAGMRAAGRDDVILLNDDALLMTPDGFAQMENLSLNHPEFGIISARIDGDACNPEQKENRGGYWEAARPMVAFIATYIPRATIDRVGELDERFAGYGYDDDDYCRRVRQAGLKIAICGNCLIEHRSLPSVFRSGKFVKSSDFTEGMERNAKLFQEKWAKNQAINTNIELQDGISWVITSAGRPDLLMRTLESFLKYNTAPIAQTILIEDGPANLPRIALPNLTYIVNETRIGQLRSIDRAYAQVRHKYIFHCEDDWEFLQSGFIEKSLKILEANPKIFEVWLIKDTLYDIDETRHDLRILDINKNGCPTLNWNPSLRRTVDYLSIGGNYERIVGNGLGIKKEAELSQYYKRLGFFAAALPGEHVRHIGKNRHVVEPLEPIAKR